MSFTDVMPVVNSVLLAILLIVAIIYIVKLIVGISPLSKRFIEVLDKMESSLKNFDEVTKNANDVVIDSKNKLSKLDGLFDAVGGVSTSLTTVKKYGPIGYVLNVMKKKLKGSDKNGL